MEYVFSLYGPFLEKLQIQAKVSLEEISLTFWTGAVAPVGVDIL